MDIRCVALIWSRLENPAMEAGIDARCDRDRGAALLLSVFGIDGLCYGLDDHLRQRVVHDGAFRPCAG